MRFDTDITRGALVVAMLVVACSDGAAGRTDAATRESDEALAQQSLPVDFDRSCSDSRCDFNLVEGDRIVHGKPTWHRADTGIGLVGDPVILSVEDGYVGHEDVDVECYDVFLLAGWDVGVTLQLVVQYQAVSEAFLDSLDAVESTDTGDSADSETVADNDGVDYYYLELGAGQVSGDVLELSRTLVKNDWQPFEVSIKAPSNRGLIRFSLEKEGVGEAVVYQLEVDGQHQCVGDEVELTVK